MGLLSATGLLSGVTGVVLDARAEAWAEALAAAEADMLRTWGNS